MTQAQLTDVGPPAPRRRLTRGQREEQLMDIAEDLFVRDGFADTTIEDIVRAAGVTRPILYEHFGSKEGVYLACVQRARRQFEETLAAVNDPALPPIEQFAAGSHVYFKLLEDDPLRWELLFGCTGLVGDALSKSLLAERTTTILQVADQYMAAVPGGDPLLVEAFAYAISGCAEQLGRWWLRHPEATRQQLVDLHLELVWPTLDRYVEASASGSKTATGPLGSDKPTKPRRRPTKGPRKT